MPKTDHIELSHEDRIPILYEDRAIMAIDKPPGWMLVPVSWQKTSWNLQAAMMSSIAAGHFWARSRNLKFIKYIHRLDAETSGILLLAKSQGALHTFEELFETRRMEKVYLAVTDRAPKEPTWTCRLSLAPHTKDIGRMIVDPEGKAAETAFRVLASVAGRHLVEARPFTGRTHQIRVHMAESGCPILGDELYSTRADEMALRAVGLAYRDPFSHKPIAIRAPLGGFFTKHRFPAVEYRVEFESMGTNTKPQTPNPREAPGSKHQGRK